MNAAWLIKKLKVLSQEEKGELKVLKIRHDLGPWTPIKGNKIDLVRGYVDVQMMTEVIKAPIIVLGAGGSNEHGPDECVPIKNLIKAEKFYQETLLKYCFK